jgi:apolipoprotein N-acyltransferase
MYIVAIAWMYVALMMAVAEATNTNGTVLGAIVTFILYGLLPVALVVYLMRSPGRKRAIKAKEALEAASIQPNSPESVTIAPNSLHPNTASHTTTTTEFDGVAPVREKS